MNVRAFVTHDPTTDYEDCIPLNNKDIVIGFCYNDRCVHIPSPSYPDVRQAGSGDVLGWRLLGLWFVGAEVGNGKMGGWRMILERDESMVGKEENGA